ncbi:FixH family protein [Ferrimonas lipolytica]|uniref:FixH family protein n=1 Tax=Ferrimonas lipolytica TaxID=2724191 RepID=A0A6H1UBZ2_9GAMM|nr:FixH family protein [Ferrimonas lipolytica]QIZ76585.1 FixH family protein [Ferrimonas lipolytica]
MKVQPWYQQFWPWFLIVLPLCAVSASLYTFYLANTSQFSLVSEDYYKKGKGINQDLSRLRAAKSLGLVFRIDQTGNTIALSQHGGDEIGTALTIRFHHATIAANDFEQVVTADGDGHYRIVTDTPVTGKWRVQIESYDSSWQLKTKITLPLSDSHWLN